MGIFCTKALSSLNWEDPNAGDNMVKKYYSTPTHTHSLKLCTDAYEAVEHSIFVILQ